jgi:hypothetical protein
VKTIPDRYCGAKIIIILIRLAAIYYLCSAAGCSIAFSFEREESPVNAEHHTS